jgi:hypothetical protein
MQKGNSRKKSITLDDLAAMMKHEFDEIGGKFDKIDGKFDKMENRFDALEAEIKKRPTIEQVDLKFQDFRKQIGLKLDNMEARLKEELGEKPLQRDRVLNIKTDTVAHKLGAKSVFTADDVRDVERIAPVAVSPLHH